MTFPEFRRVCSDAFGIEVLSVFSRTHNKLYDLKEIENQSEVMVYDTIDPANSRYSSTMDSYVFPNEEHPSKRISTIAEKFQIRLQVETVGKPGAGKTTLIWRFIRSDYHNTQYRAIAAAKFEKDIDVGDFNVHFTISDVKENGFDSFLLNDRLLEKDIILLCVAKPSLPDDWDWVEYTLHKIHEINRKAKLVVAITKSDIRLDLKYDIDLDSLADLDVLIVRTSSHESYMPSYIQTSEELFIAIAEDYIAATKGERRITRIFPRDIRSTNLSIPISTNQPLIFRLLPTLKMCWK